MFSHREELAATFNNYITSAVCILVESPRNFRLIVTWLDTNFKPKIKPSQSCLSEVLLIGRMKAQVIRLVFSGGFTEKSVSSKAL